jgi:hypothetical protein
VDPILSPVADRRISIVHDEVIRGVRPRLPKNVQTGRTIAVVAMELLMHADKRRGRVQRAAQTVAVILKDHPLLIKCRGVPLRTIQHWRSNIAEGHVDFRIISQFNSMLQEATQLVREAGGTPAHLRRGRSQTPSVRDWSINSSEISELARTNSGQDGAGESHLEFRGAQTRPCPTRR